MGGGGGDKANKGPGERAAVKVPEGIRERKRVSKKEKKRGRARLYILTAVVLVSNGLLTNSGLLDLLADFSKNSTLVNILLFLLRNTATG